MAAQSTGVDAQRQEIDRLIDAGAVAQSYSALGTFWRDHPRPAAAGFVLSRFERIRSALPLVPCRLALLRSFTVEPIVPMLQASALTSGIDLTVRVGDFNAYAQEMLDGDGWLYGYRPDVVMLAVQSRDIAPGLWDDFVRLDADRVAGEIARVSRGFREWIEACRARTPAHIVVHNLEVPSHPSRGILDTQRRDGQAAAFRAINEQLAELPVLVRGVYVLDYDGLVAEHGRSSWHDEQKWASARLPIAAGHLADLASEWLRFLHPLTGRICKVLAVDLDNTLWGGVIGEDGSAGVQLGDDYPGVAYRNLQRAILDLSERGVLLAVCSKNDHDDAIETLRMHPGMLLRPDHFAALRINWTDKADNLRAIAAELNVGIDAVAFLDDSPVERAWVRAHAPEVTVIDLPPDPMDYERALRAAPVFERLSVSAEDLQRGRYYADQRLRDDLKGAAPSVEDFLRALDMRVDIEPVEPGTFARVAQLTQKTNQFNLTTRRYGEPRIAAMAEDPAWHIDAVRVRDRFGDNGIVGVAITRASGPAHVIDTLLLSCRVIGRTIETAILSFLASRAMGEGARELLGEFIPTRKNAPAAGFYAAHGFLAVAEHDGTSAWKLDLAGGTPPPSPPWLHVHVAQRT